MMIATTWCLYLVLNVLYYTHEVSCVSMKDILRNFVFSQASRNLDGVSIRFQENNFVSFEDLKKEAKTAADVSPKDDNYMTYYSYLLLFKDHLPNVVYCKYSERITIFTTYIMYLMRASGGDLEEHIIESLNFYINNLVTVVDFIQVGVQNVSRLSNKENTFQEILQNFLNNPLMSCPIEEVGIENYYNYVLFILNREASEYMTQNCMFANLNIPSENNLIHTFNASKDEDKVWYDFLGSYARASLTVTNDFLTTLDTIYQNIFGNNNQ